VDPKLFVPFFLEITAEFDFKFLTYLLLLNTKFKFFTFTKQFLPQDRLWQRSGSRALHCLILPSFEARSSGHDLVGTVEAGTELRFHSLLLDGGRLSCGRVHD
jgi:hypothetical protein